CEAKCSGKDEPIAQSINNNMFRTSIDPIVHDNTNATRSSKAPAPYSLLIIAPRPLSISQLLNYRSPPFRMTRTIQEDHAPDLIKICTIHPTFITECPPCWLPFGIVCPTIVVLNAITPTRRIDVRRYNYSAT